MSDEKLALVLFDIGFALMLVSMVIGPFGNADNWAVTTAGIACCLALGVIVIAFQGWDVPPDEQPEDIQTDDPQEKPHDGSRNS